MSKNIPYTVWYNTWYRLSNSKKIFQGNFDSWKGQCPTGPGFYLFSCPTIPFPEKYLKWGIGQGEGGLFERLDSHYSGKIKDSFGSILNTRIGRVFQKKDKTKKYSRRDIDLGNYILKYFKKDLKKEEDRKWFIEKKCIVRVIECKSLKSRFKDLEYIEEKIEDNFLKPKNYIRLIRGHKPSSF